MEYSHAIVRMERSTTKNSGSPMWRCTTQDGQKVNVFQHSDPVKDGVRPFQEAGYFAEMDALRIGEALEWEGAPIRVKMQADGQWWKVTEVELRPEGAEPDTLWEPYIKLYRRRAQHQAQHLLRQGFNVLDVEATGIKVDDEIVSIAVVSSQTGEVMLDTRIRPRNPSKLTRIQKGGLSSVDVHGLTADMLKDAPTIDIVVSQIESVLTGSFVAGYNVRYDVDMLDRNLSDNGYEPMIYGCVWDVAQIAAEFLGNWNAKRGWFEMVKLDEACAAFGITRTDSHDAKADALATLALVKAMADADVESWGVPF